MVLSLSISFHVPYSPYPPPSSAGQDTDANLDQSWTIKSFPGDGCPGSVEMKRKRKQDTAQRTPSKRARPESEDRDNERVSDTKLNGADQSARRKIVRRIVDRTIAGDGSENESSEDDTVALQIWDEDEHGEIAVGEQDEDDEELIHAENPSKRGRGRPKGSKNKRQETPPHLPPHERYFWDNRAGASKTSTNSLNAHLLLNHDEYFNFSQSYHDSHQHSKDFLFSIHKSSFLQWDFELSNGFNLCLYGYGSKRAVIHSYAEHLQDTAHQAKTTMKIVIVNGYESSITLQDVLNPVASTLFGRHLKLPAHPPALLQLILETLDEKPPAEPTHILINSLDAQPLRRPIIQSSLASLAAHPSIRIVATCDTPNFPLMWDVTLKRQFRFLFHDCTTFECYGQEIDVVECVNALLGRSGRRIGGRDGVGYVLRSLPENARSLYRILVAEQLAAAALEDGVEANEIDDNPGLQEKGGPDGAAGVEFRVLYHKAREELVCSTEHQFRTLLKEFYDHQMVESRRDTLGIERLIVPFRTEELEGLLEDLVE